MLLGIKAIAIDENNEEKEIPSESWIIERLSINIWQISETESLIDYGFEIKNLYDKPMESIEIKVPYLIKKKKSNREYKYEIYDITERCYNDEEIGKIIFSKKFSKLEGGLVEADGIRFKPIPVETKYYKDSKIKIKLSKKLEKDKIGGFRIRVLAEDVPKITVYFPRTFRYLGIHRGYIFDIPIYDFRYYPERENYEIKKIPIIKKAYIYVIPRANLHLKNISLIQERSSNELLLETKHGIRLLEEYWRKYLEITEHDNLIEDNRKVYRGSYENISIKNPVRAFCEFEEPYSKVIFKIFLMFLFIIMGILLVSYLIYKHINIIVSTIFAFISLFIIIIKEIVIPNLIYDAFKVFSGKIRHKKK